jgi:streptogramin lyase
MRRVVLLVLMVTVACSGTSGKPAATVSTRPTSSVSSPSSALSTGGIVEYALPAPPVKPPDCFLACLATVGRLALGADGNIWFTDNNRKVIGRISPTGEVKQFSVALELVGGAQTIAAGPDGNMYVNASGGGGGKPDWILRVTPAGAITKLSAGQNPGGGFGTGPESITAGPDGNMWFTEFWTNRIGRLTPGGALTEFPIPTPESAPRGIVAGPDGNLWFVESGRSQPAIARISTSGQVVEFPIGAGPSDVAPYDIVKGPDGELWFTEMSAMGHISTDGVITQVALPQGSRPVDLVAGPDGNLWYADAGRDVLVRLGVTGVTHTYPLPRRNSIPGGMAVGADGRIWFGEGSYGLIASIGVRVPEVLISTRPLVFADSSAKTVDVRNIGDAPLVISKVGVSGVDAGLFIKGGDGCAGTSLAPDATCHVQLSHGGGGPSGIQSALLEITDNATGSPQHLSLIAQVPQCALPVMAGGTSNTPPQGEMLDVRTAQILNDANGGFENIRAASGVRTTSGGLQGVSAGYYDRPFGRWLPVYDATQVSPDGSRYAYVGLDQLPRTEVHVVDVASGTEKVWKIKPDFWALVAFTQQGIYVHIGYEGIGPGLWLLNPDTGSFTLAFADGRVTYVDGDAAWLGDRNPADKLPDVSAMGGATNEVLRRDMATGKTTVWLYKPGTNMNVVAVVGGKPILWMYDAAVTTYWILNAPNQAQQIEFPFDSDVYPSVRGFTADAAGVWVGSDEGVYLWTPRTGAVLMTDQPATPAGTCA